MFKRLLKNKKAQQTAEYALLIALVVAAVIAMQTYAQRAIQGRIRDAAAYLTDQTSALGTTNQYEPYYLTTEYDVVRDEETKDVLGKRSDKSTMIHMDQITNRTRARGFQASEYDTQFGLLNGI